MRVKLTRWPAMAISRPLRASGRRAQRSKATGEGTTQPMNVLTWYEFQTARLECECGWCGLGRDAMSGESFADGMDKHCPSCGERFGYVAFPLVIESISDPPAGPGPAASPVQAAASSSASDSDRNFAEIVQRRAGRLH